MFQTLPRGRPSVKFSPANWTNTCFHLVLIIAFIFIRSFLSLSCDERFFQRTRMIQDRRLI